MFLFAATFVLALPAAVSLAGTGIEDATCEVVSPGVYRIDFQASPGAMPVEVFASSRPDHMDSAKSIFTIREAPADVSVPEPSGRVYFHLKPTAGPIRVVSVRRLPLEGAKNFRDLGGYRTTDGSYVRWGLVYRSGHLVHLTARDSEYLSSLGIRLVCDVRSDGERARAPDHWPGDTPSGNEGEVFYVPIGSNLNSSPTVEDLKRKVAAINAETKGSVRAYDYAIQYAGQYGKILQRIAAGDLPVVTHCTAGKDRTGVFSAILLTALGVPRGTVVQDYMLSNQFLLAPDAIENTTADLQLAFGLLGRPDLLAVKTIMTSKPETLEATLDKIDQAYGSFANYLREAARLSDSDLAKIRQRLLEP
ncbi:MAG TPA: tyrosine-protein phosphatase [Candidatus Acidoferrum sp.]|nr:tyrosine-protein phosphatase [Candidatus Acidoferrum sp.]